MCDGDVVFGNLIVVMASGNSAVVGSRPNLEWELEARGRGYRHIAGVDEAGRGSLAGPVVAAAVILPESLPKQVSSQIDDSKRLTAAQRGRAYEAIVELAVSVGVGVCSSGDVDMKGIVGATKSAMVRAVAANSVKADFLLIDAVRDIGDGVAFHSMIKGDSISLSIAAASIVAKVTRDGIMSGSCDHAYPQYGFGRHKGYGTAGHLAALRSHGPSPIHRRSFRPVALMISEMSWSALGRSDAVGGVGSGSLRLPSGVGRDGEDAAVGYLVSEGYRILRRNYRTARGEVDIIAEDGGVLVFVEVKTRRGSVLGIPAEGFSERKSGRIVDAALAYLVSERGTDEVDWRVDFVGVEMSRDGDVQRVDLVRNAVVGDLSANETGEQSEFVY